MLHYLVPGGAGHLGFHVCRRLLSRGHRVHVLDDLTGYGARGNLRELEGWALMRGAAEDARQWGTWSSAYVPRPGDVDRVVWVADAPARFDRIDLQLRGVDAMLRWACGGGPGSRTPRVLVVTDDREHAAADAAVERARGVDVRRVRLGDVYGPRMAPRARVQDLLNRLSSGHDLVVDDREVCRLIHVEDAVTALCKAVDRSDIEPVLDVAGVEEWRTYDLARALQRHVSETCEVRRKSNGKARANGATSGPDPWRALGWKPSRAFSMSVSELLAWHVRGEDALAREYEDA